MSDKPGILCLTCNNPVGNPDCLVCKVVCEDCGGICEWDKDERDFVCANEYHGDIEEDGCGCVSHPDCVID